MITGRIHLDYNFCTSKMPLEHEALKPIKKNHDNAVYSITVIQYFQVGGVQRLLSTQKPIQYNTKVMLSAFTRWMNVTTLG